MSLLRRLFDLPALDPAVKASFRREQITETTLPIAVSMMEGGFVAVVAAKTFDVPAWVLAVISASPMFGNLSSFVWNRIGSARPKVPMVVTLQSLVLLCLVAIALSPRSYAGVWVLLAAVISSRLLIAGITTARSVAWSLNYGRTLRARATGRLQMIASFTTVTATGIAGLVMDAHPESFRFLYAAAACIGCVGVWSFSHVVVVGEKRQRVLERRGDNDSSGKNSFLTILRNDRNYAKYQLYQFVSGVAAMMLEPILVYLVTRQLHASYAASIAITLLIPFSMNVLTLPLWARYLDRVHVAEFRARQNAVWVLGILILWWGAVEGSLWWLAAGRVIVGIVNGGGSLAWQLGHNDFAPKDQLTAYMGIHVTLTGLRGAFAPFLGTALYLGWSSHGALPALEGLGHYVFLLSAGLGVIAWLGFDRLRKRIRKRPRREM
jgi:MFS family permease